MDRRRYLVATTALLGLSGCLRTMSTEDPTATSTRRTVTRSPTETDTPTPTETPTPTDTRTPTDTETATPTETETETPTPTPDAVERDIDVALTNIEAAIDQYATNVRLDAVPVSNRVDEDGMKERLYEARERLGHAEQLSTSDAEARIIKFAWDPYWFAWWIGPIHNAVNGAYRHRPSHTGDGRNTFVEKTETARSKLAELTEDAGAQGFDVIPDRARGEYRDCIDRFEAILDDYEEMGEITEVVQDAKATFDSAMSSYDAERYERARLDFEDAVSEFDEASETVAAFEPVSSLQSLHEKMSCYCRAMSSRSGDFLTAAEHGEAGEEELRVTVEGTATEPWNACDL